MKRNIFFLLIIACLMPFGCQNELEEKSAASTQISINAAEKWFKKFVSPSGARVAANSFLNIQSVNWEEANYYTFKFGKAVVIPLSYDKNLTPIVGDSGEPQYGLTVNQLNSLVIFKDSNGEFQERIYNVYPTNEYLVQSQGRKYKVPFSGRVIITDWNEKKIAGYEYDKGVTTGRLVLDPAQQGARIKGCYSIEWYSCASADGGNSWYCQRTGSTTNCDYFCGVCQGNTDPTVDYDGPGYYTSGGGSNSSPSVTVTTDIIVNPNLNNCFKNVISNITTDRYNAYLLKRARALFGNNGGSVNLTFTSGSAGGSLGAISADESTIYLDQNQLTDQSNEWIATVIFHELCHAIIIQYRGGFLAPSTYDQHANIFASMVSDMAGSLKQVYPNLTDNEAVALSLQGMDDYIRDGNNNIRLEVNQAAMEKFGMSLADASALASPYRSGAKGTKCNQ